MPGNSMASFEPNPGNIPACFVAGTIVQTDDGGQAIEKVALGQEVPANDKYAERYWLDLTKDPVRIKLTMPDPDFPEDTYEIELLRTKDWLAQNSVKVEGQTYVNLVFEELGLRGLARVLSVENYAGPTDGAVAQGFFRTFL